MALEAMTKIETNHDFMWADYLVFAIVLMISASIGVVYGCIKSRQKSTEEFLMANREMTIVPVSLSLLASFMSAITLLGTPAEIYVFGTQYWMIWIGYCIMIPLAAHVYIPVFYKLKLTSVFEYLEMRFHSKPLRVVAALCFIVQMVLYMAIVLYAPSLALNAVTGINVWISVFTVGIVCTFYTTLGGMKAVMWTDAFQIFIMFAGLIAILIKGSAEVGGFAKVWEYMEEGDRIEFLDWNPDPTVRHTIWALSFGGCFTWLAIFGVNQAQVQRALCVPNLKHAQGALWINMPGLTLLLTICSMCGMVMYAYYKDCDPLKSERITARDQLLPLFVMDVVDIPGIPGLFTACLFSGALSTISSGLNSLAAVTLTDFVKLLCFKELNEKQATLASKILAVIYGIIMMCLTFIAAELGGVLQAALALFGMIGGPILGLYTLGIVYPFVNKIGAWCGLLSSLALTIWLGIAQQIYKPASPKAPVSTDGCQMEDMYDNITTMATTTTEADDPADQAGYLKFYELSYMWLGTFAVIVTSVVGITVSLATGCNKGNPVESKYLCPIFDVFCCYLPSSWRRALRCNIEYDEDDDEDTKIVANGKTHSNGIDNPVIASDPTTEKYIYHGNTAL